MEQQNKISQQVGELVSMQGNIENDCHSALLFPLPGSDGRIPLGIVMLMK